MGDSAERRAWTEGPGRETPAESWLVLDDDELLHRIETFDARQDADERLLEVVASDRHFFIRQEAAKRIRDAERLKAFAGDRHIGQILARQMRRDGDVDYLEQLLRESRHLEVRNAAREQLRVLREALAREA